MPALHPARATPPSYSQGFAELVGKSAAPARFQGLVGLHIPTLGVTHPQLLDWSGYHNHGTLTSMVLTDWIQSPHTSTPGVTLDYRGSPTSVIVGAIAQQPRKSMSLLSWLGFEGLGVTRYVASKMVSAFDDGWALQVHAGGGIFFYINGQSSNIGFSPSFSNGEQHHIALTKEFVEDYAKLYIDGAEVSVTQSKAEGSSSLDSAANYVLGAKVGGSLPGAHVGPISHTALYDRAVSSLDVEADFADYLKVVRRRARVIRKAPAAAVGVVRPVEAFRSGTLAMQGGIG